MPRETDTKIDQQLADLHQAAEEQSRETLERPLANALGNSHYRVVAAAARICEEKFVYSMETHLKESFRRLIENAVKRDPSCIAKRAIIRALTAIDCADVNFYLDALHYRQMEPVWGGSADTAADIRGFAAMGLANTSYYRAAAELAPMLADPEIQVRRQVIQAVAVLRPEQAEPLLRLKAVMGDAEPEVTSEVFSALVRMEPEESARFVAGFMEADDPLLVESALLALGDSAAPETLEPLITRYEESWIQHEQRRSLIRGIALHRHERALEWLLEQIVEGSLPTAAAIVEALAEFRRNERVRQRLKKSVGQRGETELVKVFERVW
jgi:hypothetical protein